jgi:hypothetical protein
VRSLRIINKTIRRKALAKEPIITIANGIPRISLSKF